MARKSNTSAVSRALRVLIALRGHTVFGLSNKEIANAINDTPVNVTRALDALIKEGLVDQTYTTDQGAHPTYMHSIEVLKISQECFTEHELLRARLNQKEKIIRGEG
ncbi:TPA: helix-turn-helix domain-containing protein [Providencia rettgeri]|nr:IclR family transcriptional regulator [Providencia rettgeri]